VINHGAALYHTLPQGRRGIRFLENNAENPIWFIFSSLKRAYVCKDRKFTKNSKEPIVATGYVTASFAIKVGYFVLAAFAVVFVSMLVLTVLHP
jgi:hypothetical protein